LGYGGEQVQWPPHTNAITYEVRSLDDGVIHEAPTLVVTTRAMRGNAQANKDVKGQEEYSSDEGPNLSDFDRVTRVVKKATRELETEDMILQNRKKPNVINELEEVGWENKKDQTFLWTNLMKLVLPM
jgi:hypothetical protein